MTRTLFLDRDGVINEKLPDHQHVTDLDVFYLLPGVVDAIRELKGHFDHIIVVSNQRGVPQSALDEISVYMNHEIGKGYLDAILYDCHADEEHHENHKPGIGMALQAQEMFPDIAFENSVVVGDSATDVLFGRRLGAQVVKIPEDFPSLYEYARSLE